VKQAGNSPRPLPAAPILLCKSQNAARSLLTNVGSFPGKCRVSNECSGESFRMRVNGFASNSS
jgi:hypothetical protein